MPMADYRAMYLFLFNAVTDALRCLESGETHRANEILIRAQQVCEDIYLDTAEERL